MKVEIAYQDEEAFFQLATSTVDRSFRQLMVNYPQLYLDLKRHHTKKEEMDLKVYNEDDENDDEDRRAMIEEYFMYEDDEDGDVVPSHVTSYRLFGQRHRDDGPAVIREGPRNRVEIYYRYGRRYRQDEPAYVYKSANGFMAHGWYDEAGKEIHYWTYNYSENLEQPTETEEWRNEKGHHHRDEDEPAFIERNRIGVALKSLWMKRSQLHRLAGPAVVKRYPTGELKTVEYHYLNMLHRIEGPAKIKYHRDGTVRSEEWYQWGKKIPM